MQDFLNYKEEARAIRYNTKQKYKTSLIERIQTLVGVEPTGSWNEKTVEAVAHWQHVEGLKTDGMVGPSTKSKMTAGFKEIVKPLTDSEKDAVIAFTVKHEGGSRNPYSACNRDGEWRGLFDRPKKTSKGSRIPASERNKYPGFKANSHSQYHKSGGSHVGLSWGAWQITQDAGTLGRVLGFAHDEDPRLFYKTFRGKKLALEMLKILQDDTKGRIGRRSARVQPIGGVDLWEEPWVSCFKKAGQIELFQRAQRRGIMRRLNQILNPKNKINAWNQGLTLQGEIAVLFDISVQFGYSGMKKRWKRAIEKKGDDCTIHDIINELPEHRQGRRRDILKLADVWVRYEYSDD